MSRSEGGNVLWRERSTQSQKDTNRQPTNSRKLPQNIHIIRTVCGHLFSMGCTIPLKAYRLRCLVLPPTKPSWPWPQHPAKHWGRGFLLSGLPTNHVIVSSARSRSPRIRPSEPWLQRLHDWGRGYLFELRFRLIVSACGEPIPTNPFRKLVQVSVFFVKVSRRNVVSDGCLAFVGEGAEIKPYVINCYSRFPFTLRS